MIRIRAIAIAAVFVALTGCADIRELLIRNNYLSTGRAPEGWAPEKGLCPDFNRNGWQDHPPANDGCWAPVPEVEPRAPAKDAQKKLVAVQQMKGRIRK